MDKLYGEFREVLEALLGAVAIEDARYNVTDCGASVESLLKLAQRAPHEDSINFLSAFLTEYVLEVAQRDFDDTLIKTCAVVLDLAHAMDAAVPNGFFLMQAFLSLAGLFAAQEASFEIFCDWLFDPRNNFRVLNLTRNNNLTGKLRPGSKLLALVKQVQEMTLGFVPGANARLHEFRVLVLGALDINDKLSRALDWHTNAKNGCYKTALTVPGIKGTGSHTPTAFVLFNFLRLMVALTEKPWEEVIGAQNAASNLAHSCFAQYANVVSALSSLKKSTTRATPFQIEWVGNFTAFTTQLHALNKFHTFAIQNRILVMGMLSMTKESMGPLIDKARAEVGKKFRLVPQMAVLLQEGAITSKLKTWVPLLEALSADFHAQEVAYALGPSERTWSLMKLKAFAHPSVQALQNLDPTQEQKRKLEEHSEVHNSERIIKRPKLVHTMGTPKLTKIWRVDNSLQKLKPSVDKDMLGTVKDDLYFARGKLTEMGPDDTDRPEQKALCDNLIWKECRLERLNSHWLSKEVEF